MPLAFLTPPLSLSKTPKLAKMDHSSMHQNMVGISSCSSQDYHNHHQKKSTASSPAAAAAVRPSPPEQSLRCPRCDSTNTKFCYYNNYSLSQPRYFCKSCRRYWTKGGILRNIPVGGGYRKHKRSSATKSLRTTPEPTHNGSILGMGSNGYINNEQMDLGLAFALLNKQPFGGSGFLPEFGSSQLENANYAFGNGGSGLEETTAVDPNRALWGFPWQMNMGGGNGHVDQIDSGRDVWSSINYINTGALL